MTLKLPPFDSSAIAGLEDLARRFYEFASHVHEFFRLMPTLELKTLTTVGDFPIYVETQTPRALGVLRVQTYKTLTPGATSVVTGDTAITWRLSDDPNVPGIIITALGGVIGPEELTTTLLVLGERA